MRFRLPSTTRSCARSSTRTPTSCSRCPPRSVSRRCYRTRQRRCWPPGTRGPPRSRSRIAPGRRWPRPIRTWTDSPSTFATASSGCRCRRTRSRRRPRSTAPRRCCAPARSWAARFSSIPARRDPSTACPVGGRRSSTTPRSSSRRGGRGMPTAARCSRDLRICFVAGAGLAPVQHERFSARGGGRFVVDPDTYVDTSSYARQGVDALTRVLGIDVVVLGSDRPYAEPVDAHLGDAARHAIAVTNPLATTAPNRERSPTHECVVRRRWNSPTASRPALRSALRTSPPRRVPTSTTFPTAISPRTSCCASPRRSSAQSEAVAARGGLRRRHGPPALRVPAPRRARRRLAAVLDAGRRHRLARPRRVLGRGRRGAGVPHRAQPRRRRGERRHRGPCRAGLQLRARTTSTGSPDATTTSVSVHAYSPPLWRMGQYAVAGNGVLRRVSVSYADELRPLGPEPIVEPRERFMTDYEIEDVLDLLVVGGGVMGLFTAYHASASFGRVAVLERGDGRRSADRVVRPHPLVPARLPRPGVRALRGRGGRGCGPTSSARPAPTCWSGAAA